MTHLCTMYISIVNLRPFVNMFFFFLNVLQRNLTRTLDKQILKTESSNDKKVCLGNPLDIIQYHKTAVAQKLVTFAATPRLYLQLC